MKNIPRPSRWVLHEQERDRSKRPFDLGVRLKRYRGSRSLGWLLILFAALAFMVWWLSDFPLQ